MKRRGPTLVEVVVVISPENTLVVETAMPPALQLSPIASMNCCSAMETKFASGDSGIAMLNGVAGVVGSWKVVWHWLFMSKLLSVIEYAVKT